MKIKIINETEITQGLDLKLKKILCRCFSNDAEFFAKSRAWHGSTPAWSVILDENDSIVAHVSIVDRTIKAGSILLRVAGIQNVSVLPEYRGQGLCKKVMLAAMKEAGKRDFDAGLLYCVPQLENAYIRYGWRLLSNKKIIRIDENGKHIPFPVKNIAMFFPLKMQEFPRGSINLQGNDW